MGKKLHGKISGRSVVLDEDPEMSDGTPVVVDIALDRAAAFRELCGAWKDDPSLPEIFAEIEAERHRDRGREVPIE